MDSSDAESPCVFSTKFGRVKYVQSALPAAKQMKIKTAYYLHNTVSSSFIRKVMKEDSQTSLLVFQPTSNYQNVH